MGYLGPIMQQFTVLYGNFTLSAALLNCVVPKGSVLGPLLFCGVPQGSVLGPPLFCELS